MHNITFIPTATERFTFIWSRASLHICTQAARTATNPDILRCFYFGCRAFSGDTPIWYVEIKCVAFKDASGMTAVHRHDTLGRSRLGLPSEIMPVAAGCIWNSLNAPFAISTVETSKQRHTMLMSRLFTERGWFLNLIRPSTNTPVISSFPTVCSWVLRLNTGGSLRCLLTHDVKCNRFCTESALIALINTLITSPRCYSFQPIIWCQLYKMVVVRCARVTYPWTSFSRRTR